MDALLATRIVILKRRDLRTGNGDARFLTARWAPPPPRNALRTQCDDGTKLTATMITMMMMMLMGKVIVAEERMDGLHNKRWATALTSGTVPPYRPDHGFFVRWSVRPHQIVTTHIHTPICGENRKESDSDRVVVGQSSQSGVFCPITGLDTHT